MFSPFPKGGAMRWLVILVLVLSQISRAGLQQSEAGSRAKALGGAYAAAGGDAWTLFFNVGGLSRLERNEVSFFYSPSPFGLPELGVAREPLPQVFAIGIEYIPAGGVSLVGDYRKESGRAGAARFGFEYRIVTALALRAGFSDAESRTTGGIGVQYGLFRLDYAFEAHQELGWTHELTLSIRWGGGHD